MNDYIKREDAIKEANTWSMFGNDSLESRLKRLPSADVEPVRHARWENLDEYSWSANIAGRCQICGWIVDNTQSRAFAYCPNCGARMDGIPCMVIRKSEDQKNE